MKIVIMAGGTGPIALQRGLFDALERDLDGIEIKVLVNAYDNGLSTGAVRHVMNGRILGPSDVRKNQTTRLRLTDPNNAWLKFLDLRFSSASADEAKVLCLERADRLVEELHGQGRSTESHVMLRHAIDEYFSHARAKEVMYEHFSLANIIYAGLCARHGNSLRAAASVMAKALGIRDYVLINDDRSLFLGAITRSGRRIADESDIVSCGDETDPFEDIFFLDEAGNEALPQLCFEAWEAIVDADLIILSSGSQWSSLIPTYASRGFKAAIRSSMAKVVMVMNRAPDKDGPGQAASDIIDILVPRYFDEGRLHVLADINGHPSMRSLNQSALGKVASFDGMKLSWPTDAADKHDPAHLARAIGYVYFSDFLHSDLFLFDYDDTLYGRKGEFQKSSKFNVRKLGLLNALTNVAICTGNSIRTLTLRDEEAAGEGLADARAKPLVVFADGGVNEYTFDLCKAQQVPEFVKCVSPEALLAKAGPHSVQQLFDTLTHAGIPAWKIENRGNAIVAIKPIEPSHRGALVNFLRHLVSGSDLEVRESGRTTVEIRKRSMSKVYALEYLRAGRDRPPTITYLGDECDCGNDREIDMLAREDSGVRCLPVAGPSMTAFFIHTLTAMLCNDGSS